MTDREQAAPMWANVDKSRSGAVHYSVLSLARGADSMAALRTLFPEGRADDLNFVLFSTSGVHGTYNLIEEAEQHLLAPVEGETSGDVTFLVVHPRMCALRYGVCEPANADDIAFLKRLRDSSHRAAAEIGRAGGGG